MSVLNGALRAIFDGLLYPFRDLHPMIGLALVSLLAALLVLLVFRYTTDQRALAAVKRQVHAGFYELRLFADDPPALLAVQWDLLRRNLRYLRLSLVPMTVLIVPFVLVIAQLQFHYGYRGLRGGEPALVEVRLDPGWRADPAVVRSPSGRPDIHLTPPAGVRVESSAVWAPSREEMTWRVGVDTPGQHLLAVEIAGRTLTKTLDASDRILRRSPARLRAGFLDQLLYPAEPPLPADVPVRAITVTCPEASITLLGISTHWLVWFFVLSLLFAFALRRRLGVTF